METLTIQQAYDAMICFLEHWSQLKPSDEIAVLLGGLHLNWVDPSTGERWSGDPAFWDDWMRCVQSILYPDTPENRQRLEELISEPGNHLGKDSWGNDWYATILPDGKQLWATVRNGELQYGGLRQQPKSFNPSYGLSSPENP